MRNMVIGLTAAMAVVAGTTLMASAHGYRGSAAGQRYEGYSSQQGAYGRGQYGREYPRQYGAGKYHGQEYGRGEYRGRMYGRGEYRGRTYGRGEYRGRTYGRGEYRGRTYGPGERREQRGGYRNYRD